MHFVVIPTDMNCMFQDKRKDIENLVGVKLKSMLCVPVSSRNSDGLIALACVVNKKDTEQ